MIRCYLAHPVTDYGGSDRQRAAIRLIEAAGMSVVSPDSADHETAYRARGMAHFIDTVATCDALAFLRFEDGTVGAGVAAEIEAALGRSIPVFEITPAGLVSRGTVPCALSVDETRAKIMAIRARAGAA